MNDDKRIQELFDSFTPALKNNELFNKRLERKFAMIDEIQQTETKQIRRYRMAVVAAFVAGIVLGSGLLVFILAIPSDTPLFTFGINFYPLQFIEQNSRMICVLLTSLMIAFCIIAMMNTSEMVSRIRGREM